MEPAKSSVRSRFNFHPAAELFPLMAEPELGALAEDIRAHGLRQPIVMHQGKVLDGRNRLLACERAGVEPRFVEWRGTDSPAAWVVSQNLHRRHLTDTQRKFIAAEAQKLYAEEARGRMEEGRNQYSSPTADRREGSGTAAENAARDLGVAPREVEKAKLVSEKAPTLKKAVLAGVASLDAAAALADEPETRQRELVAAGPKAIKEAAKTKRASKKATRPAPRASAAARPTSASGSGDTALPDRVRVFIERTESISKLEDPKHVRGLLRMALGCLNATEKEVRKLNSEFENWFFKLNS
jgi:hypothetical protein